MKKRTTIIVAACTAAALALGGIGVYAAGQLTKAAAITEEEAYRFALADAGVNAENASFLHVEYEIEQGTPVYDVEFVADGVEYDYDIKAEDGTVLKKEADPVRSSDRTVPAAPADPAVSEPIPAGAPVAETPAAEQTVQAITEEEAVAAALEKAGKAKDEVVFTEIRRDHDDGREVYDIEFTVPGEAEYDYEIDAVTGEIREQSTEKLEKADKADKADKTEKPAVEPAPEAQPTADPAATTDSEITVEDAKRIALGHAGKSGGEVVFEKAKREKDDGRWIYEVEFFVDGVSEYEYEIDAATGEILEEDIEDWDGDD